MDPGRFDGLARALSQGITRRTLTPLLGGLALAGTLVSLLDAEAGDRRRRNRRTPRTPSACGVGQSLCFVPAPRTCRRVCQRTKHGRVCRQKCSRGSNTLVCVDTQNDPAHCGTCNHSCLAFAGPTATCQAGACTPPLTTPLAGPTTLPPPPPSPPPPPPSGGAPCVAYGGGCMQSADCCDGIPCTGSLCRYD
jgi:hypothetical protein